MPNSELQPFSPVSKRNRHERKRSSGEFSIEELLPDDMGYDADIEVVRPDTYEDVESDSDGTSTLPKDWHNVDEELAARMRHLGRDPSPIQKERPDRGRKRRSVEMDVGGDDDTLLRIPPSPGLEVQEVVDNAIAPSPAKRRRKKSSYPSAVRYLVRADGQTWVDSAQKSERSPKAMHNTSTSSTPSALSGHGTPRQDDDDDEMVDVT